MRAKHFLIQVEADLLMSRLKHSVEDDGGSNRSMVLFDELSKVDAIKF